MPTSPSRSADEETDSDEESGDNPPDGQSRRRLRMVRMSAPVGGEDGTTRSSVSPQVLSLPQGGGTLEGMGESFEPQLSTGQASFSVPIAVPPGRGGLQPELELRYSSGGGSSIVGLGWSLEVPSISRQSDRGMPRYEAGSLDHFVFGGRELVPIASTTGPEMPPGEEWPAFVAAGRSGWTYFRARIEGDFRRFFLRSDERQWVVQSPDGTTLTFGELDGVAETSPAVVDFEEGSKRNVWRWQLTSVVDSSGNRLEYRYARSDGQSYLVSVFWNNPPGAEQAGELDSYQHGLTVSYEKRADSFSSYVSGYRVATDRRVTSIQISTVPFGLAPGSPCDPVRSYSFRYDPESVISLLSAVQAHGGWCESDAGPRL